MREREDRGLTAEEYNNLKTSNRLQCSCDATQEVIDSAGVKEREGLSALDGYRTAAETIEVTTAASIPLRTRPPAFDICSHKDIPWDNAHALPVSTN